MNLIDSHCHLHGDDFGLPIEPVLTAAWAAGVGRMITVGTDVANSRLALEFAVAHDGVFAVVGIHPGEDPKGTVADLEKIIGAKPAKLIGLGDIGLDYHYGQETRAEQIKLLEAQLDLAAKYDLPVSFHVREAFADFWPIFDNFSGLRGTLHSFTDGLSNMEKGLSRGLYISLNGILTFNHQPELDKVFATVPLENVLLETDAPFLAPKPHRGKINQPAYVRDIAAALAAKRGKTIDEIAEITTNNAQKLFNMVK
ncbi:MAG: TatD family hydrolase [Candidatus Nomurabacteria bacterium]|jgi:TatD DNase family protein|nr:TatD family hydrolase [Candidatus Nomurabacteria bacterium]